MFKLLQKRDILDILIGDKSFGTLVEGDIKIEISMPYLKGSVLCEISNKFDLFVEYGAGGMSRWRYLDALFAHCIQTGKVAELLSFLFSKAQFSEKLKGLTRAIVEKIYPQIIDGIIAQINGILSFDDKELVCDRGVFLIRSIGVIVSVNTPSIKAIDRTYIADISARAMDDIDRGYYDSALTKSRTLLEEVFCHVVERKGEVPSDKGKIAILYRQVKSLYKMHANKETDVRINELLSGLEKILSAVAEMRNKGSDSHGLGAKRFSIAEHHARLFVNSAMTMADFILSVSSKALRK